MKKLTALALVLMLAVSAFATAFAADSIGKTDDMEKYAVGEQFKANSGQDYGNFGAGSTGCFASDAQAHSGKISLMIEGRSAKDASFKFTNLFTRTLTKEDVGKTFEISFWVYADKSKGVYKNTVSSIADAIPFTKEELDKSTGTYFNFALTGPDGQNYTYRHQNDASAAAHDEGYEQYTKTYFVKWNEWTEISLRYTVKEAFLDNGSEEKGKNPAITGLKFFQNNCLDFSVDQGLANTFYVDDLKVEEYVAPVVETPAEKPAENPATADIAVILAAVACVSASGAVIVRRKNRK